MKPSFKRHLEQQQIEEAVLEYLVLSDPMIEEGKLEDILGKAGLHLHKGKGLIQYFASAGKGVAGLIKAAIQGDKEKAMEIVKSVKKGDVLDFLFKLDQATLHLITGPIHLIDAVTGWHLWAAVEKTMKGAEEVVAKIVAAIKTVKDNLANVLPTKAPRYNKVLTKLETEVST